MRVMEYGAEPLVPAKFTRVVKVCADEAIDITAQNTRTKSSGELTSDGMTALRVRVAANPVRNICFSPDFDCPPMPASGQYERVCTRLAGSLDDSLVAPAGIEPA